MCHRITFAIWGKNWGKVWGTKDMCGVMAYTVARIAINTV